MAIIPPARARYRHWSIGCCSRTVYPSSEDSDFNDPPKLTATKLADPYVDMVSGQVIVPAATADGRPIGSGILSGTAYLGYGETDWTIPGDYTDGDT
jgi:hypothetical protein